MGQGVILIVAMVALGLFCAGRSGLGVPLLEKALRGEPMGLDFQRLLLPSLGLEVAIGAVLIVFDEMIFRPHLPAALLAASHVPAWQGFLASFYGGITEELLLRLGVMSVLAWLFGRISHTPEGRPSATAMWLAILAAAILFGLGHLPAAKALAPLTPLVIARGLVLNGLAGIVCGHLYWRHGLEAAMLAHFAADLVLHLLGPLVSYG